MKITIDTDAHTLTSDDAHGLAHTISLYSKQAFEVISRQWVKIGWNQKYPYTFSWMGRPIIQLPEDMVRTQEVIYKVQPDVLIETGVAHGGSLIYYASLFKALGRGRVIGVDIEIRPNNRHAIESHEMAALITLVEGSSTASQVVNYVKSLVKHGEKVMVILDSNHTKKHVGDELEMYHPLVTSGSYIVATDGIQQEFHDMPRGKPEWVWDHPSAAAQEFAAAHPEFVLEQPAWPFSESDLTENITHWPSAWLRRM